VAGEAEAPPLEHRRAQRQHGVDRVRAGGDVQAVPVVDRDLELQTTRRPGAARSRPRRPRRALERKRKRVKELEAEIAAGEARLEAMREALRGDPGGDWEKLAAKAAEEQALAKRVDAAMTEWMALSHQAADYLRGKGAAVIMKDIEESPAAAAEMREKLEKSHQRGGSIPIIDVRGQILVGFSPSALDRALARAAAGTAL
jgi:hypothetical protein